MWFFSIFFLGLLSWVFYHLRMGRKKEKTPVILKVSDQELTQIKKNVESNELGEREKKIVISILETYYYLVALYRAKKLSIQKLARMFGFKSEKQGNKKKNADKDDKSNPPTAPSGKDNKKGNGHGRKGKDDFPGAKKEAHTLNDLKPGDPCPECPLGKLYPVRPGSYIHFTGSAPLDVTIHETEKLRCNGCGKYFEADLDDGLKQKYDPSADVAIAVQKYALGLPFYRMGNWQRYLGIPLSASTQWERCEVLVNSIYLVYKILLDLASNGRLFGGDDTGGRILDVEKEEREKGAAKRSVWTTGIMSETDDGLIALFFTSIKHCGQNMSALLKERKEESVAIFMSDALSRNLPKEVRLLWANCIVHARRNFWDYRNDFPRHVKYVLYLFGKLYKNERTCKNRGYNDEERMRYHQKHSRWIMEKLRRWSILQVCRGKVEPNGELGGALRYYLKHYEKLTLFLRVPGVPLDNSAVEALLKVPILNRKNAYFYKTQFGALVGDVLMSLIETCKKAKKSPFHYLLSLHENKDLVKVAPEKWLPWNYEQALPEATS